MGFISTLNNFLSFAAIIVLLRSFPFVFDVLANVTAVLALITIFDAAKDLVRKHLLNRRIPSANKAVFITGCDSGFGRLAAVRFDQLGYHVFAGCLFPTGESADDLKLRTSTKLQILGLDVTNHQSVLNALEFVKKNLKDGEVLWAVLNNAGIAHAGEIEWTSVEEIFRVIDVNTMGTVRVTKAFLPLLRKSKGRVVNNTSFNGRLTSPGYVGYCMSKTAAVSFTNGLRMEMDKWRVKVISVEPFFYRTPLTGTERSLKMIENTFDEAPEHIKTSYGREYLNAFKQCTVRLLARSSPNVNEVIDCFEDAITAEEPQRDYFPCNLPDKVLVKLFRILPQSVVDAFQQSQMPKFTKSTESVSGKDSIKTMY